MTIIDSHWDSESIDFKNIGLDVENPRIPSRFHGFPDAVFNFLLHNEEVVELANSIIRAGGMYPQESIICLKEGETEYTVLEGNRRLSAVRILHDPKLLKVAGIPEHALHDFDPELLKNINFMAASVVSTRAIAKPILAALHLSSGKHPWSDRRKVAFAAIETKRGASYLEISEFLLCSESEALEYICNGKILDAIQGLGWSEDEYDIIDNDKLRLSAMFKALTTNVAQKYFGQPIFMANGDINTQLPNYETIIKTIIEDSLFWQLSRDTLFRINENTNYSHYFKQRFASDDKRDSKESDLFHNIPSTHLNKTDLSEQSVPSKGFSNSDENTNTPDNWNRHETIEFFEYFNYSGKDERTSLLVRELSRLSSKSFENQKKGFQIFSLSASFLMRAILEWVIHVRVTERGYFSSFQGFVGKGRPSLDHFLSFAVRNYRVLGVGKDIAQKIESIRNDSALKNDLQWNIHNNKGNSSPERVSEIAKKIRPILESLLN